jgi:hypothetical protein
MKNINSLWILKHLKLRWLEDSPEIKLNKDHLLSFRVNDELYINLTKKLLILDLSLSEYLRTLINKDTNE